MLPHFNTHRMRTAQRLPGKLDSRDAGTTALFHHGECACRSSGQGHGQADQRTGRGRAAQLMGVSLGFPKGCGSPVATSKCSAF